MSVIRPKVTRIHCTAVSHNPFIGLMHGQTFPQPVFCGVMHGDACFFFWGVSGFYPAPLGALIILRVKADGSWCWYISQGQNSYLPRNAYTTGKQLDNSSCLLMLSQSGYNKVMHVVVPSYFISGGFIPFVPGAFNLPAVPCGATITTTQTYYGAGGHTLTEYVQAFGSNYNLWAATYIISSNGIVLINAGQCGNFPNSVDPLVSNNSPLSGIYAPGFANATTFFDAIGNQIVSDCDLTGQPNSNYLAVISSTVTDGSLYCGGVGSLPNYSISANYAYWSQDPVFNGCAFKTHYQSNQMAATDLPCSALCNQYSAMQLFNGPTFVELYSSAADPFYTNAVFLAQSNVWVQLSADGVFYVNTPDSPLPPMNPPPVAGNNWTSLLNWHRPISTRGLYKT